MRETNEEATYSIIKATQRQEEEKKSDTLFTQSIYGFVFDANYLVFLCIKRNLWDEPNTWHKKTEQIAQIIRSTCISSESNCPIEESKHKIAHKRNIEQYKMCCKWPFFDNIVHMKWNVQEWRQQKKTCIKIILKPFYMIEWILWDSTHPNYTTTNEINHKL